jgi:hypothetical protein
MRSRTLTNALENKGKHPHTSREQEGVAVKNTLEKSGPFFALGGMSIALFLYAYSAIARAGLITSVLLPLLWLVLFALTCRWFTRRPATVVLVPVVTIALWFAVVLR